MGDIRRVLDGMRVLIVEDESDTRDLLGIVLEWHGASVFLTGNVADGLEVHRKQLPDVIVTDIGMPGMDGYSLIKALRALPPETGGNTPAVALTAHARSQDRRRAMLSGFDIHVARPVEPSELLAVVARLARRA